MTARPKKYRKKNSILQKRAIIWPVVMKPWQGERVDFMAQAEA